MNLFVTSAPWTVLRFSQHTTPSGCVWSERMGGGQEFVLINELAKSVKLAGIVYNYINNS